MEITWDDRKRDRNLEIHGLDFRAIERFLWRSAIFRPTYSGSYGGRRVKIIGLLDGDLVAAVFSALGTEGLSLISLRRASRTERRDYEQAWRHS